MRDFRRAGATVLVAVFLALTACTAASPASVTPSSSPSTIRFASFDFQENQILAELYAEAARRRGLPVSVQHGIGTREVVSPALQQGVVDVVIDYLGTALDFVRPGATKELHTDAEMQASLTRTMGGRGVDVLHAARAEDQNGFAVTTSFAARHRVDRLSALRPLAPGLVFGGPAECPGRPFCLPGLKSVYGLDFGHVRSMTSRAATVEALVSGEIDVGMLETTDARLSEAPILLLLDDKSLQPPENVVPLVRLSVVRHWGSRLTQAFDELSARLTTADLVQLNRMVEVDGRTPAEAAAAWWAVS